MMTEKPPPVPGKEGTSTVEWCPVCGCKTWHFDGVCEWWDTHKPEVTALDWDQDEIDGVIVHNPSAARGPWPCGGA